MGVEKIVKEGRQMQWCTVLDKKKTDSEKNKKNWTIFFFTIAINFNETSMA